MRTTFRYIADTRAATSAEYALVLAIVGACLVTAAVAFRETLNCSLERSGALIAGIVSDSEQANQGLGGNAKGNRKRCR